MSGWWAANRKFFLTKKYFIYLTLFPLIQLFIYIKQLLFAGICGAGWNSCPKKWKSTNGDPFLSHHLLQYHPFSLQLLNQVKMCDDLSLILTHEFIHCSNLCSNLQFHAGSCFFEFPNLLWWHTSLSNRLFLLYLKADKSFATKARILLKNPEFLTSRKPLRKDEKVWCLLRSWQHKSVEYIEREQIIECLTLLNIPDLP